MLFIINLLNGILKTYTLSTFAIFGTGNAGTVFICQKIKKFQKSKCIQR